MRPKFKQLAMAAAVTLSGQIPWATPASAYQVDCAILLCIAGGWPASAPCTHARAVFIRRITPWPVEPPLQIWRCPLGASFMPVETPIPSERLYEAANWTALPRQSYPADAPLREVQSTDRADVDISDETFDFVRSIRVFHIQYSQRENREGECTRWDVTRLGTYGIQGDYHWTLSKASEVPSASRLRVPVGCNNYFYRSVFVEWRDHAGNYGSEEVRY
ncbi:hypothetical protein [Sagittula sp. S175]|uniref:hypothetical protein n=1 Tax=Sagittula sp. S175 TaxID=3415129 RepID=UPI003C7B1626